MDNYDEYPNRDQGERGTKKSNRRRLGILFLAVAAIALIAGASTTTMSINIEDSRNKGGDLHQPQEEARQDSYLNNGEHGKINALANIELESKLVEHMKIDIGVKSQAVEKISDYIREQYGQQPDSYFDGSNWKTNLLRPNAVAYNKALNVYWNVETSMGLIVFHLRPDFARYHVTNTIYLTLLGFYDDTIWHRIIPRFMGQFGDPTGTGRGSPGYKYAGEFFRSSDAVHSSRGTLSTANAGPETDGSQVFVLFDKAPHLDGKHTVFGKMVSGEDALAKIESVGSNSGKPKQRVLLKKAWISVEQAEK
eukprot:CFRG5579T1